MNEPSNIATNIQLPKEKINENNFEECMKSSKRIFPIPAGSIGQMFNDTGPVVLPFWQVKAKRKYLVVLTNVFKRE